MSTLDAGGGGGGRRRGAGGGGAGRGRGRASTLPAWMTRGPAIGDRSVVVVGRGRAAEGRDVVEDRRGRVDDDDDDLHEAVVWMDVGKTATYA